MSLALTHLEALLEGIVTPAAAHDEAAWHSHWHQHGLGGHAPAEMALLGGMMARSLPQVFIAGYQAALRAVFPDLPAEGWAAFVAAEDQKDPETYPGTRLTEGPCLDGHKSWIGQSRHVRHLYVTARQEGETKVAIIDAAAPGVTLTHRDNPRFLSGLSQGFASFEAVVPSRVLDDFDPRTFGRTEPQFVMLASAGFIAAHLTGAARDRSIALAAALTDYCSADIWRAKLLAALDRELTALSDEVDGAAIPGWQADRRLISMYSPRIQKRA